MIGLYRQFNQERLDGDPFSIPYIRGKTAEFLTLVAMEYQVAENIRRLYPLSDYCAPVYQALKFIHANFLSEISLEQISRHAALSVRSFTRLFRSIVGMSFVEYLQYLRVHHARKLVERTSQPLLSIALESGFHSASYFHRIFTRFCGISPSEYREKSCEKWMVYPRVDSNYWGR